MSPRRRTADARPALSRARILRAAQRLADKGGIEAISMRKLGQVLGVEAMSLYNHVRDKEDVLDGIADLVAARIDLAPRGDWRASLHAIALSAHEQLIRHPWACALLMSPARDVPARMRYIETVLGHLRGAGFSAATTYHAYHAFDSHVLGFTMWEIGHSSGAATDLDDEVERFLRELPPGEFRYLAEHAGLHLGRAPDGHSEFEFGLELIIDGLGKIRDREEP